MKPLRYLFACLLVICVTVLFFSLFNRGLLCELRIKNGNQEVAAKLACSDRKCYAGGVRSALLVGVRVLNAPVLICLFKHCVTLINCCHRTSNNNSEK